MKWSRRRLSLQIMGRISELAVGCELVRKWHGRPARGSGEPRTMGKMPLPPRTAGNSQMRGRSFLGLPEVVDLLHELGDVAEFLVHAGEAHVGDLVDPPQVPHHRLADGAAGNFAFILGLQRVDDVVNDHGDLLEIDRTLVAGRADRMQELFPVKFLAPLIPFDPVSYTHLTLPT